MNIEIQHILSNAQSMWRSIWASPPEQIDCAIHSTRDLIEALRLNNGRYIASEASLSPGGIDQAILDDAEMRGLVRWGLSGGLWSAELEVTLTKQGRALCGLS